MRCVRGATLDASLSGFEIPPRLTRRGRLPRLALSAILFTCPPAGLARADKSAGGFLRVPAGARAVGMGGAFVALADDGSAPFWNPAGLALLGAREILYQHAEQFGGAANYD